jgi:multidrug efflux pump subunit AcrB
VISNLFTRNARLTALAIGLVVVAGLAALQNLARQEDPTLARRFGTVTTFFPGASALRVESLVTEKIEAELREIYEIREVASLSRTGVSSIFLEFRDEVGRDDVDELWSRVRDHVADARAQLPPGVSEPEVEDRTSTAVTLIASFVWQRDDAPQLDILTRLAEELQNRLRNLPGTREVELFGEAEEEIRVTIDPADLVSRNLTVAEVARAIAQADSKVPAGQLRHGRSDLLIEVEGELTSVGRIQRIPIRQEADGRALRVGDAARVEKTRREPAATLAIVAGRPAVAVAVTMEPNRRVDLWAQQARRIVDEFRRDVPRGLSLDLTFDQSVYTHERLSDLVANLLLAAGIVLGVLLFMMGARSAVIVGAALPLTMAMALALFHLIDLPLHQTSVTGLIIALGLLIDNAIVVVDEYGSRVRRGAAPVDAVASAVRHLFVPLLASTLTTVLAFLPIALAPGAISEFVGPISLGVIFAVLCSFTLSMTVIPALAARFSPQPAPATPRGWWRGGFASPRLTALYRRSLDAVLRRPWLGVAVSLVLPLLGFAAAGGLTEQFFPPNDRNQFQVQLVLPSHASLAETAEQARQARERIEAHDEVLESHWFVGEGAPRVFYNMLPNQEGVASFAGAFVTTRSAEDTERLLPELQRELSRAFPNARVVATPFEQGPPFDAPIEVRLVGPDLEVLRRLGEEMRAVLAESKRVTYTAAQLAGGQPKLVVRADEEEARLAGLSLVDIAGQLSARLEGATGGSVLEANQELPVRVRAGREERGSLADITAGSLLPAARAPRPGSDTGPLPGVPLAALAEVELVPELAGITRRNGERTNTVQAFLEPYALIAESLQDFRQRLEAADLALPPGYRIEFGGEDEERGEALAQLLAFALPLFVIMAGTTILSFNSFRMAAIIGVVAGLSVGLAMLGVWIFGYPLGFLAIVGTMGLVGLAINGAIVVLSALRADAGACAADAERAREVVMGATRHILATTLTTMGGFFPLIAFGGRFWPPLATAIAGGVAGSALLALYLAPSLFIWSARRDRRGNRKSRPQPAAARAA